MNVMRALVILVSATALVCSSAAAASRKKALRLVEPPMRFHVVRSGHAGCEPRCLQWIAAQGKIVPGTARRFRRILRKLGRRKLPVFIHSGGGAVNDALAIGRLIRARGLYVAVTRTAFPPCTPAHSPCREARTSGELRGLAQARLSACASSCAFILAGGVARFVGPGTAVGVHQVTLIRRKYRVRARRTASGRVRRRRTLVSSRKVRAGRRSYTRVRRYLAEMGIGKDIMALILSTPTDRIRWLTPQELTATRLATDNLNGEQLVSPVPATVPGVPPGVPGPATVPEMPGSLLVCLRYGACKDGNPGAPKPGLPSGLPGVLVPPPTEQPTPPPR